MIVITDTMTGVAEVVEDGAGATAAKTGEWKAGTTTTMTGGTKGGVAGLTRLVEGVPPAVVVMTNHTIGVIGIDRRGGMTPVPPVSMVLAVVVYHGKNVGGGIVIAFRNDDDLFPTQGVTQEGGNGATTVKAEIEGDTAPLGQDL
jgi:hypothetical protein